MRPLWRSYAYDLRVTALKLTEMGRYYLENYIPVRVDDKTIKLVKPGTVEVAADDVQTGIETGIETGKSMKINVTVKDALRKYGEILGVDVNSRSREVEKVTARFAAWHALVENHGYNYSQIARETGFAPWTVRYGVIRFGDLLELEGPLAMGYREKVKDI